MHEPVNDASISASPGNSRLTTTVDLVAAYVSNNSIRAADLASLIETVYGTLGQLSQAKAEAPVEAPQAPAVPIKKSITPDFLICLEDGKKFRSLKRHIGTVYNLTPDQYRAKWGLGHDYPMVAPAYSAVRSKLAKDIGLGRPAKAAAKAAAAPPKVSEPASAAAPKKSSGRGRKKAAA